VVTFALVHVFRTQSLTNHEALFGFVISGVATAAAVLLYGGPNRRPARVATIVMACPSPRPGT